MNQKGMTFLEVLVAALIIGIGITGSISMLQSASRYSQTAMDKGAMQFYIDNLVNNAKINPSWVQVFVDTDMETLSKTEKQCKDLDKPPELLKAECYLKNWYTNVLLDFPDAEVNIQQTKSSNSYEIITQWTKVPESSDGSVKIKKSKLSMLFTI